MSLRVLHTLRQAVRQLVWPSSIVAIAVYFFATLGFIAALQNLSLVVPQPVSLLFTGSALVSLPGGVIMATLTALVTGVLALWSVATGFAVYTTWTRDTIPSVFFSVSGVVRALRIFLAGITVFFLVTLGFALFILPGFYLLLAFGLYGPAAANGLPVWTSLRTSWNLSKHVKLRLFAIFLVLALLQAGVLALQLFVLSPSFSFHLLTTLTVFYTVACIANAYRQVGGELR